MKTLIAEDDVTSRMLLERLLVKWGYEMVVTCDGDQAWQVLQAEDAPRLAILDWMMPGLDGVEVCRKVREQETRVPTYIIILTIRDSKKDIIEGLEAGANDYIAKPFHNDELRMRIAVAHRVVELQAALAGRIKELENALDHVKTLQGIVPICMHCHKIRNDQESWERLEKYITEHTGAEFSHGLCPECAEKFYGKSRKGDK